MMAGKKAKWAKIKYVPGQELEPIKREKTEDFNRGLWRKEEAYQVSNVRIRVRVNSEGQS